ncbi:unnamed protein product [Lathyrus sativus]|nr:unnamed protein product [Lathyrus sativus]
MENDGTSQTQCLHISQESTHQPIPNESGNQSVDAPLPTPNDNMEVDSQTIVSRRSRHRSIVWDHFTKVKVDGKDKAKCNYCSKLLNGSSNDGTTHLKGHMESCPKKKLLKPSDKGQTFLTPKTMQGKQELSTRIYDAENAKKELVRAIILHEYPLSIVDHIGFRRYSVSLQPLFQVPCRNSIKKEILKVYNLERSSTLKLLENLEGRVVITSDLWTSSNKKKDIWLSLLITLMESGIYRVTF